jgi:hypothetical protein
VGLFPIDAMKKRKPPKLVVDMTKRKRPMNHYLVTLPLSSGVHMHCYLMCKVSSTIVGSRTAGVDAGW